MEEIYRSQFRLPYSLFEKLKASAGSQRRSVNAELVARLEESFEREKTQQLVIERLESAKASRPEGQSEAAAVLMQGIEELRAQLADFQVMASRLPTKD